MRPHPYDYSTGLARGNATPNGYHIKADVERLLAEFEYDVTVAAEAGQAPPLTPDFDVRLGYRAQFYP